MNKGIGIALLIIGIVLIVYGINASDSASSGFSRIFTGAPTIKHCGCCWAAAAAPLWAQ